MTPSRTRTSLSGWSPTAGSKRHHGRLRNGCSPDTRGGRCPSTRVHVCTPDGVKSPTAPSLRRPIADLRAHIPRSVGLIAPDTDEGRSWLGTVAGQLHRAGLPVEVLSDAAISVDPAIEVRPIH